jgi:hypothetical protein
VIENFFGKLMEFRRIALRADKTDPSLSAVVHPPPHSSIRDESQRALGEKALCADLRPYAARSTNDRYTGRLESTLSEHSRSGQGR